MIDEWYKLIDWKTLSIILATLQGVLLTLPIGIAVSIEKLAKRASEYIFSRQLSAITTTNKLFAYRSNEFNQVLEQLANSDSKELNQERYDSSKKILTDLKSILSVYKRTIDDMSKWRNRSSIYIRGAVIPGILFIISVLLSATSAGVSDSELYVPLGFYYRIFLNHLLLIISGLTTVIGIFYALKTLWLTLAKSK